MECSDWKNTKMLKIIVCFLLCIAFADAYFGVPTDEQDENASPQLGPGMTDDLNLTPEQRKAIEEGQDTTSDKVIQKWPNAVIPYNIDCSLENMLDAVAAIKEAMAEWESKTCIRFVKHTNEKDYLTFFRHERCWGNLGRVGGESKISVGDACEFKNVMAHEIGHAIGFFHEHNRKDRDKYVKIEWDNVNEWAKTAFRKLKKSLSFGVPYDYTSIMHYPWNAFSKNGKNTLKALREVKSQPYLSVSKIDVLQMNKMYSCQKRQSRKRRDVEDCEDKSHLCRAYVKAGYCYTSDYVRENCKTSCNVPYCDTTVLCIDKKEECRNWKRWGHCKRSRTVMELCPKTCNPRCQIDCKDENEECAGWAKYGYCQLSKLVWKLCPKSCRHFKCKKGLLCEDRHEKCEYWAKHGECKNNPRYMKRFCKASCNQTDCDMGPQRPAGSCANPLGIGDDGKGYKLPDSRMTATSISRPGKNWTADAFNARLYMKDDHKKKRIGAWCIETYEHLKAGPYLQIDFGEQKNIQYIATQGRPQYFERIAKFKVKYSKDGRKWKDYTENWKIREFEGNCDHFTPILNKFNNIIKARFFRYYPLEANFPCLRMELYGC
eukprot:Seg2002.8 transcript_id=Seg2002.8/GoldUCD/mRNA.D3Y31 product="Astacin-like metalloendopeptidase" protein_id=Seg2002.8/GoldUCD/D3Y31